MRVRTFVGILVALVVAISVTYLHNQNTALLHQPFRLSAERSVPVYLVVIAVFLVGFLPAVSVLLTQTLKRDLALRRDRRRSREAKSLKNSFRRAVDLQEDGQWGRAAAELEGVLIDKPEDFATLLRYGEVLRHLGRAEEALEVHRRASVLYPQSVAVLYQLAEDYQVAGEGEVAHQIRDRVLRDFSGLGLQVLRRRRNAALGARDWREAGRLQERIDAMLAESGDAAALEREEGVRMGLTYQKGIDLLEGERVAEAKQIFSGILEKEPHFMPAAIMLGETELMGGGPEAAVDVWRKGFEATGSPVFLQRIEDHFIENEQPLAAIETLHGLIARADSDLLPRFFLGRLYYRLEMHSEALKILDGLRDRIESSPTYHFLMSRIHQRRGEMAKSVESLMACVQGVGVATAELVCRICGSKYREWVDRCDACGSWNAVELDFEEEKISAEELGVRKAPVFAIYHGAGAPRREPDSEAG